MSSASPYFHDILPLEITEMVVLHCSHREMYNLTLVDRTISHLATALLYHTVDTCELQSKGTGNAFLFPLTIVFHEHLGRFVKNLYLSDIELSYIAGNKFEKYKDRLCDKYGPLATNTTHADRKRIAKALCAEALTKMPNLQSLKIEANEAFFKDVQGVQLSKLVSFCFIPRSLSFSSGLATFMASQPSLEKFYIQDMLGDDVAKAPHVWEPALSQVQVPMRLPSLQLIGWENATALADANTIAGEADIRTIVVDMAGFICLSKNSMTPYISIQEKTAVNVRTAVFLFRGPTPERHHLEEILKHYSSLVTLKFQLQSFSIDFVFLLLDTCKNVTNIRHIVIEGAVGGVDETDLPLQIMRNHLLESASRIEDQCTFLHFASFRITGTPELCMNNLPADGSCSECSNLSRNRWDERPTFPTSSWLSCSSSLP